MERFSGFIKLCEKSIDLDQWVRERKIDGYAEELKGESEEVIVAVKNKDKANLMDELGDVLLDWAHLALLAGEEYGFTVEEIVDGAISKLNRRKPYLREDGDGGRSRKDLERSQEGGEGWKS